MKHKQSGWINGLDSIRFVLAFIVFLSHLTNPYHEYLVHSPHYLLRLTGMAWGILFSGVGAVMAFFIISGFVIHYPNRGNYPDTIPFLIRRWLRIGLPLLVISLIARAEGQFSAIPIWSLYCELVYYTIYPVLIRIKASWGLKFGISFLISAVIIVCCAPNDWSSFIHHRDAGYSGAYWQLGDFFTWIVGLPCWLLGVILAEKTDLSGDKVTTRGIFIWRVGILLTGMGLDILKFHFYFGYFFSMNFFAILLFFWIKKEILYFRDRPALPFLEYCGKFSYSLYLCHNIISFYVEKFMPLNVYTYFPVILITIFISYLFYRSVEYPSHLFSRMAAKWVKGSKMTLSAK